MPRYRGAQGHRDIYIYGRFYGGGGGGGHSDAKSGIFQFSPFFSKMSFRRGGYVIPFRNLQEMAVSERYGLGGVGGHSFEIRGRTFGHFGVFGVCTVRTCRLCPAPCAILLSRPLFVAQVHFSCCFLSATMPPKAKRLILGSPSPKKRKLSPNDKLVGRQYHFYKGISRRTLMEAIPYERQQTLLVDMHNNIDEDIFDFNDIRQRHTVQALLNCFLAFSEGSQQLARYLYDTVGDRLFGSKQDSFLDTILVDRLKDTITLLKKDTGPQGVAVVEVLCAAICPTNVEGSQPCGCETDPPQPEFKTGGSPPGSACRQGVCSHCPTQPLGAKYMQRGVVVPVQTRLDPLQPIEVKRK